MADVHAAVQTEAGQSELRWLEQSRLGDDTAVAALVARHRARLIRVAANVLRDRHEAEDVAQERFSRAFASYLYRICVRLCMDRLRGRRPEPGIVDQAQDSAAPKVETRVLVERLLTELSPDLRLTLVLREMEQLSYEEVATAMNVPVGTVRSRLHTARERFRNLWLEAMAEEA
jgi:RNA polymerase sigma-70 factor, ECF subfamily